jgi:hypothetical protein
VLGSDRGEGIEPTGNQTPVRGLHGAHRDQIQAGSYGLDEPLQRHGLHAHAAIGVRQERE